MNRFDSINNLVDHHMRFLPDRIFKVAVLLWDKSYRDGWSDLSVGEIAEKTGLANGTVRNVLSDLYARGWLVNAPAKGGRGLSRVRRQLIIPGKETSSGATAETVTPRGADTAETVTAPVTDQARETVTAPMTDTAETVTAGARNCHGWRAPIRKTELYSEHTQRADGGEGEDSNDDHGGDHLPGFNRFWTAWPNRPEGRKTARKDCERFWSRNGLEAIGDRVLATLAGAKSSATWKRAGGRFIPKPLKWLEESSWEERAPAMAGSGGHNANGNGFYREDR